MLELVLANARLVTPDAVVAGSLVMRDGRIAAVDSGARVPAGAIDCEGDLVIPGLIDIHADNFENHLMPRPGAFWPERAALLNHDIGVIGAGITTVLDSIALGAFEDDGPRKRYSETAIAAITAAGSAGELRADHRLHLRCELPAPDVVALASPRLADPLVTLVSVMDHTPGQRGERDIASFRRYYRDRFRWGEAEIDQFIADRLERQARYATANMREVLALARAHNRPVASHDDTTAEHVADAKAQGVVISEFPTTLEAARTARALGLGVVMGAPNIVRGGSNSGNVSAAEVARAGLVDMLASDYVPGSLLHAALLLSDDVGLPLPDAVATVTRIPADQLGLNDRGRLAEGALADVVRVRWMGEAAVVRGVWREGRSVFT